MDGDHLTVNRGKEEAREREREVDRKMARRRNEFPIRFLGISDEFLFFFRWCKTRLETTMAASSE